MKLGLIVLVIVGILAVCGLVMAGSLFGTHNELIQEREAIKASWAQVDVVLQRRADLIPNLVETVKGYAKHEETAIDSVGKYQVQFGVIPAMVPLNQLYDPSFAAEALK